MTNDILDLRKGARFVFHEPVTGSFGPADVTAVNISLQGIQLAHEHPLRIGTRARVLLKRGDVSIAAPAQVVWSHLARSGSALAYRSGLRFEATDAALAAAINAFYRAGVVYQDKESLERKREAIAERERQRAAKVKVIPTSEPPPT